MSRTVHGMHADAYYIECESFFVYKGGVGRKKLSGICVTQYSISIGTNVHLARFVMLITFKSKHIVLTSLSLFPQEMPRFGIARSMATSDCIVLLQTTGLYCLKSSLVNPLSWIILQQKKGKCVSQNSLNFSNIVVGGDQTTGFFANVLTILCH